MDVPLLPRPAVHHDRGHVAVLHAHPLLDLVHQVMRRRPLVLPSRAHLDGQRRGAEDAVHAPDDAVQLGDPLHQARAHACVHACEKEAGISVWCGK